ncbi:dihydrolipoyl dehydrogenase family protein [Parapedobacter tibetensis]|uniref:dihydrolipoyl dehydrogenase family protein n=1 Tax=Parapedobacter tibetensis TaxID=2972951 RepID=UPI00214D8DDB|nr:NAD(P)/FAD-dependent oxidoreductase [Parapedobacter tibetensis]
MDQNKYDIIVIGCGSGGLSVGLFMRMVGLNVLMVSKSDHDIGGDCLNDGCVPSKALIHAAKIAHYAKQAQNFGLSIEGRIDIKKVTDYIKSGQEKIRVHENAAWLREQGIDVALGEAFFVGKNEIAVSGTRYQAKKIVIATGSSPKKLHVPGVEKVAYYDNENIFNIATVPKRLLVIGAGPIGMEISQAMSRLGSKVTVLSHGKHLLPHDDQSVSTVLLEQLKKEGITLQFDAEITSFSSPNEAVVTRQDGSTEHIFFDAVFVGIGRKIVLETLHLNNAGIEVQGNKIKTDAYLRTSNKHVFVCGDVAGDLQFSHAAEFHARILLNNFFSPFRKRLRNDHFSWVTFTDPEVATFGLSEQALKERNISYTKLEQDFKDDDRAVTDNYQYGKLILYLTRKNIFGKQRLLGGTMVAPNAGELIQELVMANSQGLSVNALFDKIYPYPTASRINQKAIVDLKSRGLGSVVKRLLRVTYKLFS